METVPTWLAVLIALLSFFTGVLCVISSENKTQPGKANCDKDELFRQMYASFTDEELKRRIHSEMELKAMGFDPSTLDIRKRGFDPEVIDTIVSQISRELARRAVFYRGRAI